MKPTLQPSGTKRLKLKCDILQSTAAFKINLCRYSLDFESRGEPAPPAGPHIQFPDCLIMVYQCAHTLAASFTLAVHAF